MASRNKDPRLQDETKAEELRRLVKELAEDLPQLAKIALEALVRDHDRELRGNNAPAGRAGRQSGNVSELTVIATL